MSAVETVETTGLPRRSSGDSNGETRAELFALVRELLANNATLVAEQRAERKAADDRARAISDAFSASARASSEALAAAKLETAREIAALQKELTARINEGAIGAVEVRSKVSHIQTLISAVSGLAGAFLLWLAQRVFGGAAGGKP